MLPNLIQSLYNPPDIQNQPSQKVQIQPLILRLKKHDSAPAPGFSYQHVMCLNEHLLVAYHQLHMLLALFKEPSPQLMSRSRDILCTFLPCLRHLLPCSQQSSSTLIFFFFVAPSPWYIKDPLSLLTRSPNFNGFNPFAPYHQSQVHNMVRFDSSHLVLNITSIES